MKIQIPIYRANKIDSNEYVEGFYFQENRPIDNPKCQADIEDSKRYVLKHFIRNSKYVRNTLKIDQSTLAIHFPDMIDSEGTKIFASLSESGKGGDKFEVTRKYFGMNSSIREKWVATFKKSQFSQRHCLYESLYYDLKVTGIQS